MKAGDLVCFKKSHKQSGELALILETAGKSAVKVILVNTGQIISSLSSSMDLINEL